ncbi:MAG: peptidylprolyl isomerase [Elusimicrobiota bacterium]|jgi:parvulin-like peptidyl-prolyl isomerase|nr:peptidylprolyl isomerase [Elusimicrobiota bacterium]
MHKLIPAALLICFLCACGNETPQTPEEQLQPDTLAVIAGTPLTQTDFDAAAQELDKDFQNFVKTPAGKENFLNFLVNERLLLAAAQADIAGAPKFEEEMAVFRKEQEAALKTRRESLLRTMLMEKLRNDGVISVSEDEIKAYHRKYPYQITIAHILMDDPQKAAAVMREIGNVRTQDKFGEYARKFSADPATAKKGGLLPPFIPGEYLPEIEAPAANSPAGQPQGFIKTALGFHIIMKVREESISLKNAQERIQEILEKQKTDAYLATLKERYGVEVINNEGK